MSLTGKRCECGNAASYGLPTDRKRLWCGPCGKKHGAVLLQQQKMCEDCGLKCAGFGLLAEKKRRWSAPIPARLLSPLPGFAFLQITFRFPDFQRRNPAAETRRDKELSGVCVVDRCGPCGKPHGGVRLTSTKMCESCGKSHCHYGLPDQKKPRW